MEAAATTVYNRPLPNSLILKSLRARFSTPPYTFQGEPAKQIIIHNNYPTCLSLPPLPILQYPLASSPHIVDGRIYLLILHADKYK